MALVILRKKWDYQYKTANSGSEWKQVCLDNTETLSDSLADLLQ